MKETGLLINSIYRAIEGEGVLLGFPQVFVRLQGCHIGCLNCDSKDTWSFAPEFWMSMEEVLSTVEEQSYGKIMRVSVTGGDPLHPKHETGVLELIGRLKKRGYTVTIEASGSRIVPSIFDLVDFVNFDFKTPSTGVTTRTDLVVELAQKYPGKYQIKSVVADSADFEFVLSAKLRIEQQVKEKIVNWCLTPAYETGEEFPRQRFLDMIELNLNNGGAFRFIGQQHKWIYGPDLKQV